MEAPDLLKNRAWMDYEASMTLSGCVKRIHKNRQFITNLTEVFSYLCNKLCVLCNYSSAVHVFVNRGLPEAHVILGDLRRPNEETYRAVSLTEADHRTLLRLSLDKRSRDKSVPSLGSLTQVNLDQVLKLLGARDSQKGYDGLVLPFDYGSLNLGYFILWHQRSAARPVLDATNEALRGWVAAFYGFLETFFKREFSAYSETYLPSYFASRWGRAAIMFADIRNFTPLTEILRNTYARPGQQETVVLRSILNEYSSEMAKIVQEGQRGRIDKFLGDGIMAIFGEYTTNPSKTATRALMSAVLMVEKFAELRPKFLKRAFGGTYDIEYNESVSIDLGVGINYGTVLFDYFGDGAHSEYTAVGDHVNFAQRLESQASRADERTGEMRPPILISATVERCCRPWLSRTTPVTITPKGKGQSYAVYGLFPHDFKRDLYRMSEENDSWDTPWRGTDCGPPQASVESQQT